MSIDSVVDFLNRASHDGKGGVSGSEMSSLGSSQVPQVFLGLEEGWLRGDQHRVWMRWFLDRMVSPYQFRSSNGVSRNDVLTVVAGRVRQMFPGAPGVTLRDLSNVATDHIFAEVVRLENARKRDRATPATRLSLIAQSKRCYICGYEFPQEAIDRFSGKRGVAPPGLPGNVDIYMPRGLLEQDLRIDIEHVIPVAAGGHGQANLKLACGWCNRWKSAHGSIYDVSTKTLLAKTAFKVGNVTQFELPHPYWLVRLLMMRRRCSHEYPCDNTPEVTAFAVAPVDVYGSPNPSNLAVYCSDHDPLASKRLKSRAEAAAIWDKKTVP